MPIYITLFNLTDQGIKNIKDAPKRFEQGAKAFEEMGGKLIGFYLTMGGIGAHEVIIESPEHLVSLSDLPEERLVEVFSIYRERLAALGQNPRLAHGMIFKNVGAAAGASIEHIHSQLIATPIVPSFTRGRRLAAATGGGRRQGDQRPAGFPAAAWREPLLH